MRAFLSHSSKDKDFVTAVARDLGRHRCVFDEFTFRTGDDLRQAIREGLHESTLFVLFASVNSMNSHWVDFELDEAEALRIERHLKGVLVFLMSAEMDVGDLPVWLRRTKVTKAASAKSVSREIQRGMQTVAHRQQRPIYVGRQKERAAAEQSILTADSPSRNLVFVTGLTGIGRRAFLARLSTDVFNLATDVVIRVESGDGMSELASRLAEEVEVYSGAAELRALVELISTESDDICLSRIARYCRTLVAEQQMPVFYDDGGLIDDDGRLHSGVSAVLEYTSEDPALYCAFVTNRTPRFDGASSFGRPPVVRLPPLPRVDSIRLLTRLCDESAKSKLTGVQIRDLADYVRGYPPSAYYAKALIQIYGPDVLAADTERLVAFRAAGFVSYLGRRGMLDGHRKAILGTLSYYSPLPLYVLSEILELTGEQVSRDLVFLIDCSLVVLEENGHYAIADPVIEAVHRAIALSEVDHTRVATAITRHLRELSSKDHGVLVLARSLFRANRFASILGVDNTQADLEIALLSDFVRLTQESYHARNYDATIRYGRIAAEKAPGNRDARSFVVRALAQLGRREEAIAELQSYKSTARPRDVYFLLGFVERLCGDLAAAESAFVESLRRGRRGLAIHREVAHVYFLLGDLANARRHVDIALSSPRGSENRFLVDLQIQIAIRQRDEETVTEKLRLLEQIDNEGFCDHRKSTAELAFGRLQDAYTSIRRAIEKTRPPTAAMLAQAARCSIEVGDFEAAEQSLEFLRRDFRYKARRLVPKLECRYEIARGNFGDALQMLDEESADDSVSLLLRLRALEGVVQEQGISAADRSRFTRQLDHIRSLVERSGGSDFEVEIG